MVADVALVGAGIMSATLGTLLREIEPELSIAVFERLDRAAAESSDAWNNAGTGHSGFCELNYTPAAPDGSVDVSKAITIAEQFEVSRQLWASLVERGSLPDPRAFVRPIPHVSFVWGSDVDFLRARHRAMSGSPLFKGVEITEDPEQIAGRIPLVMEGRGPGPVAATWMTAGTDVNFGALTRAMLRRLDVHLHHEVLGFERRDDRWAIELRDLASGATREQLARFVFIGAGGGSLSLLERTGIPEAKDYGAFPVSGQWLRCTNRKVIERHHAKVYGQAEVGAPPMSVPHLDTRWIDARQELLFGPYAGFTTKFLKRGSFLDLFRSLRLDNALSMMGVGAGHFDLMRYLMGQALLSRAKRTAALRRYFPGARSDDWESQVAGLRVQVIKSDGAGGGVLRFGTEVVTSADGSMAALLGASPGASTAASIMLEVLRRCFSDRWRKWERRSRSLIPSLGQSLHADSALCRSTRKRTGAVLRLEGPS